MYNYTKRLIISVFVTILCLPAKADKGDTLGIHKVYEFKIDYPLNKTKLFPDYMDNMRQLEQIEWFIKNVPQIGDSLIIYSYASPEGPYSNNARLTKGRGETARLYLRSLFNDKSLADSIIVVNPTPENWEGLRQLVEAEYTRDDKDKVLEIINSSLPPEVKKNRLKKVSYGYAWLHLLEDFMPRLRYATWVGKWQNPYRRIDTLPAGPYFTDKLRYDYQFPLYPRNLQEIFIPDKKTRVAFKTNLLYDAATVLNFAVEVPFNEKFSILYEHHCPWWLSENNKYCLQFLSFGGEFRWWFKPQTRPETEKRVKRDALVGHFLGLYGWGGKLDFQNVRKICYQAEFNSLGITYGYSMPIAKRFNMEFSISAGYAEIPYRHYNPDDEFDLLIRDKYKTGTWRYFGPTKVEVALVVPFLFKTKKGGRYERIY